jgi:SAM-dependent methyltransferase
MKGILLDFGCGSKPYRNLFSVQKYIGVDIEKSGHDHLDEEIDYFYDGYKLPFEDDYFDSCFSSEVFEHVFNINEILHELHRVLKTEANLLVTVPFVWEEHEIPYDYCRYTSFGLRYLLEKHGFEIVRCEKAGSYVATIFQIWINYLTKCILPQNKYIKTLLVILIISPFTITGILLSKVLPNKNTFYLNNVIVARKIR